MSKAFSIAAVLLGVCAGFAPALRAQVERASIIGKIQYSASEAPGSSAPSLPATSRANAIPACGRRSSTSFGSAWNLSPLPLRLFHSPGHTLGLSAGSVLFEAVFSVRFHTTRRS